MPSIKRLDTFVFIFLSFLLVGSVLLGYKTFSIPPSYVKYLGCGEQCEALQHTSEDLEKPILKFGKQTPHEPTHQTDIWKSLADSQKSFRDILQSRGPICFGQHVLVPNLDLTAFYRAIFLNPLYLLSVLLGMPFYIFLSMLCCGLLGVNALLLEKVTINGHRQTYGKGFFLAAQLPFVLFGLAKIAFTMFGTVMLLYAIYPPHLKRTRTYILTCCCLSFVLIARSAFMALWIMLLVHCIVHWRALMAAHRRTIIMTILVFFPFILSAAFDDFYSTTSVVLANIKHGSLFLWYTDRQILQSLSLIPLYIIALCPLVPKLSKSLWLDFDFHALCVIVSLVGMFLSASHGRILLLLNCLLVKVCLERYFFKNNTHVPTPSPPPANSPGKSYATAL